MNTSNQNQSFGVKPRALRWGIIGAGNIASEWMIPAIRSEGQGQVVAVLSSDAKRAAEFAAANGIARHGADRAAFFAHADMDAVYVCSTNERHAGDTIEAAAAGKHVLCEKPMALNEGSAMSMIEACRRAKVVLGVNHHMRCMDTHRTIRDIVRSGELGRLTMARLMFGIGLPEEAKRWRVKNRPAGGGSLFDLSVHIADLLRFLFEEEIDELVCMADGCETPFDAESTTQLLVRMKSGLMVTTAESFETPEARTSLEIHGSRGTLVAEDVLLQAGIGAVRIQSKNEVREVPIDLKTPYVRVIGEFSAAVHGEGRPAASGEDGFLSLLAVLRARESAVTGRRIKIPARPKLTEFAK